MKKSKTVVSTFVFLSLIWALASCKKSTDNNNLPPGPYKLSYGDSILYLKPAAGDNILFPLTHRDGVYSGFPEGIEIDALTGAINLNNSEAGLRYRITHVSPTGDTTQTLVVLSGITFTDHFFKLADGDSIANPVYNSNPGRILPINDASGKSLNKLKVLLYWYNTMADVPQYLWDILNDRTSQGVFLRNGTFNTADFASRTEQVAKPRPPCVIIIAH